uniref:Uncharacterized protein LOC114348058 n=1 Tax=Diabrotica virgifera virgifera TaxID=50390 RepID=A0A6P7HFH5_DIAVI
MLYTFFLIIIYGLTTLYTLYQTLQSKDIIVNFLTPIFCGSIVAYLINSVCIARKWRKFMVTLSSVEVDFIRKYGAPPHLKRNINLMIFIYFALILGEYSK